MRQVKEHNRTTDAELQVDYALPFGAGCQAAIRRDTNVLAATEDQLP
jgi:hypothetical protein